jgi:hypothetical protein
MRHADAESTAGLEHTAGLRHSARHIVDVHEGVVRDDQVEASALKGERRRVGNEIRLSRIELSRCGDERRRRIDAGDPMTQLL